MIVDAIGWAWAIVLVAAVLTTAFVIPRAWRHGFNRGYAKAMSDRAALLKLAADLATHYNVSVDDAQRLITVGTLLPADERRNR